LLRADRPLLFPVAFVADEDLVDAFGCVLFDVGEPGSDVWGEKGWVSMTYVDRCVSSQVVFSPKIGLGARPPFSKRKLGTRTVKRPLICDIVDQQDAHCPAIVCRGDSSETLLTRSIPYL